MQNDELGRRFMEAQGRVAAIEGSKNPAPNTQAQVEPSRQGGEQNAAPQFLNEQVQAHAVATQAMYESQGFPAGAARAAAQAMNASTPNPMQAIQTPDPGPTPPMQPGATMQAMAVFQQAAANAMQAATPTQQHPVQTPAPSAPQMQPGATMQAMAAFQQAAGTAMQAAMGMNPAGNPQQAYADAMNAFAQQAGQAQYAAAQQQGMQQHAFMGFPASMPIPMQWQQPPTKPVEQQQDQPQQGQAI